MSKEDNMMIGFTIVAIAGDARAEIMRAFEAAKSKNFQEAQAHIENANQFINEAHVEQTQLLAKESRGEVGEMSFVMVHGQDHLMTTMALRDIAKYFIDVYQQLERFER
ncbi:PTS lactose/cellobiose transporter subunit IIA [Staphylococcus coagulans]|uniref:PTS system lactose-specific EIIA component n=1 Tax=Staphylococcus coagulans TaxID=74706 RepID=A0ABU1F0B6_9STAP|nr:PTS lactose/cellobiose transporter subunit IIA [Staphylococcus coagulans]AKS67164.1 PTS system lactose-specific transporter subunit IIA [Staphylococcus schleiferi]MBA8773529.1 PTS lactose transporter subunit IIA [Staphylococcus coagulans]MBT2813847.1 PTS lactose/cellobiose transporter subunit IIA [Staphylococcus coagulans]MBT2816166.1 PTS lactose/cellobiose transporter subunit IIA [Staphylococcus coagulans]MBT2836501.1 PTS lactose/cellobiose transporter subunit IIA [Staphylococcus coagulans